MSILKIMAGLACLIAAFFMGSFAWVSLMWGVPWFKFIPVIFTLGLIAIGLLLIFRRNSMLSNLTRGIVGLFFSVLIIMPIILDVHIRHQRHELQKRAQAFLARPIPKLLVPDSEGYVGGYFVDTNAGTANGVFGYSRVLIERYATKGRIRWSAAIQAEFACTGDNCLNPNISDEVTTNEAVRRYSAESHAILAQEWRMGFWQWVEDTMEFKSVIPEIEEENRVDRFIQRINGTWTNGNGETMTISPNGTFSARWIRAEKTNVFMGTESFRGKDSTLVVIRDSQSVFLQDGDKKEIRILHVDDHNLIYELAGQTNSMSR